MYAANGACLDSFFSGACAQQQNIGDAVQKLLFLGQKQAISLSPSQTVCSAGAEAEASTTC